MTTASTDNWRIEICISREVSAETDLQAAKMVVEELRDALAASFGDREATGLKPFETKVTAHHTGDSKDKEEETDA